MININNKNDQHKKPRKLAYLSIKLLKENIRLYYFKKKVQYFSVGREMFILSPLIQLKNHNLIFAKINLSHSA